MLWRWLKHGVQPNAEAARRREQLYEHEIPMRKHMAANSLDEELYECASDLLTERLHTRCACGMSHFQLNRPLLLHCCHKTSEADVFARHLAVEPRRRSVVLPN